MDNEELRELIAERIREKASAQNLGLNQLADAAGVSRPHLYSVLGKRRAPTIEWLAKISVPLRCQVYELLEPPPPDHRWTRL